MRRRVQSTPAIMLLMLTLIGIGQLPAAGQAPGRRGGPPRFPLMTAVDANGDGEVSAAEMAAAAENIKKLDKNRDGKLDREEMRPQFPGGQGPRPGDRMRRPGGGQTDVAEKAPVPKNDKEKAILATLEKIHREQGRMMNVPETDGRMLRLLTEAMGAKKVVEIGTSNGISAIWIGTALRKTGGKLITYEIDAQRAELARKNFAKAGMSDLIEVIVGDAHEEVAKLTGPIDLVFLDADKAGYLDYLAKLLPLVRPGGLITAHNMTERMADPKFVKAITTNPDLETLFYRQGGGMAVTMKKR